MVSFKSDLIPAKFIKRYKRFFVDAKLPDGTIITAHCANTGSMKTCFWDDCDVYFSESSDPNRKLKFSWELTRTNGGFICINTSLPNKIVQQAVRDGNVSELKGYENIQPEVKYGKNSRIDLLLSEHKKDKRVCYVEVKNTTLLIDHEAVFPDAVTERGLKHIVELEEMLKNGHRAVMFFLVNRPDATQFRPCHEIDPKYAAALNRFVKNGGEVLAYSTKTDLKTIEIDSRIPTIFDRLSH